MDRSARKISLGHTRADLSIKANTLITELLSSGVCTESKVAERLSMNRRTLNRNLANEGSTYSEILTCVRLRMLREWYSSPSMTLTALASSMGFKSLSALCRWRRAHEDHAWRKALLGPDETYWTDGDAYAFVIKLEPLKRRRKQET